MNKNPAFEEIGSSQYKKLFDILTAAHNQASAGKGKERHAEEGEPFEDQQICEIARRLKGHPAAGPLFQAVKKIYESGRLPGQRGIDELLGAIIYISAAVILMEEEKNKQEVIENGR